MNDSTRTSTTTAAITANMSSTSSAATATRTAVTRTVTETSSSPIPPKKAPTISTESCAPSASTSPGLTVPDVTVAPAATNPLMTGGNQTSNETMSENAKASHASLTTSAVRTRYGPSSRSVQRIAERAISMTARTPNVPRAIASRPGFAASTAARKSSTIVSTMDAPGGSPCAHAAVP